MDEYAHAGRRGDTRARIQQVALELFAEQGYERTSLREIAERLGVTKAALYYHFKSKEDIVRSFTEDYFARLDALIAWGAEQPPGAETARELIDRYITIVLESGEVFRFLERNQATIHGTEDGKHRFTQFRPRLTALMEVITGPDAPPRSRIRAAAAIFAVSTSCMFFMKDSPDAEFDAVLPAPPSQEELREIVLEFATDLTSGAKRYCLEMHLRDVKAHLTYEVLLYQSISTQGLPGWRQKFCGTRLRAIIWSPPFAVVGTDAAEVRRAGQLARPGRPPRHRHR